MELPSPINGTEQYLAAVLEEIRGLRSDIAEIRAELAERANTATNIVNEPVARQKAKRADE